MLRNRSVAFRKISFALVKSSFDCGFYLPSDSARTHALVWLTDTARLKPYQRMCKPHGAREDADRNHTLYLFHRMSQNRFEFCRISFARIAEIDLVMFCAASMDGHYARGDP